MYFRLKEDSPEHGPTEQRVESLIAVETTLVSVSEDFLKRLILATHERAAKRLGLDDGSDLSESFEWGFQPPDD